MRRNPFLLILDRPPRLNIKYYPTRPYRPIYLGDLCNIRAVGYLIL